MAKYTVKQMLEEVVERIEVIHEHLEALEKVGSFVANRMQGYQNFRTDYGNLRSTLIERELEEWRGLLMWGLVVDEKTRDRIKAMAHDRFLGEDASVSHWLSPNGVELSSWLHSDAEEFREMVRKEFAPKEEK